MRQQRLSVFLSFFAYSALQIISFAVGEKKKEAFPILFLAQFLYFPGLYSALLLLFEGENMIFSYSQALRY